MTSKNVYTLFKLIETGNNTYPKLINKFKKTQPEIVELMQPLLKSKLIIKKQYTGFKGVPTIFLINKTELSNQFPNFKNLKVNYFGGLK